MNDRMKMMIAMMAMVLLPVGVQAQNDDFGMWFSAGVTKKIDTRWNVGVEAEYRLRNDMKTSDRWSVGVDGSYKVLPWLKASAGYTLLYDNNEKKSYYDDPEEDVDEDTGEPYGYYGKLKRYAKYWGVRHRFNVSLTASYKIGRLDISLRERWQYTYRPSKTASRAYYTYDLDGNETSYTEDYDEKTYKGKGKNVLRSRLSLEYNIPRCKVDPFVSVEAYNVWPQWVIIYGIKILPPFVSAETYAWSLYKMRYTVGADWKIAKPHTLSFYYRYQHVRGNDDIDDEPNRHIIGLEYKFKF